MNKAELIEALSAHFGGNKAEAGRMLNIVVETIIHETARHGKVGITGFGVFEKVHREERVVRNPRTGERKKADETYVVRFRPGSDMKAYVAGERELPSAPVARDVRATRKNGSRRRDAKAANKG
ncbi:HU family DNA-binding protein [Ammonicoccus fulvus]|uniref:HU family DNA-binding protein n=1 Tax=Ammonicoccus fulvus TaxID=3138240 RepID=A0ABZ3FPJ4_9ACTN